MRSSTSTEGLRSRLAAAEWLVALPPLAATAIVLCLAAGDLAGRAPWLEARPRNGAEAAATGDAPAVLRFVRSGGHDPGRVYALRSGTLSRGIVFATTAEAALWSGRIEMVRLLDREGAIAARERAALGCLAEDLEQTDTADYLAPSRACVPGRELERLRLRSRINAGEHHD